MVFSKELMRQLRPGLTDCLKNLLTEHEDIELGRCVRRVTKVQCATAWSARRLFFQNYNKGTYDNNILNPTDEQIGMLLIKIILILYHHHYRVTVQAVPTNLPTTLYV